MSTVNLSKYDSTSVPDASGMRFGIVVSDWNEKITHSLLDGAVNTLLRSGAKQSDLTIKHVPGSFELILGAHLIARNRSVDAVICLGCVIQGETPHFNYVCKGVTEGVTRLNIEHNLPFIFGVLTTSNQKQAEERSGGQKGNKGIEAAVTAIKMAALKQDLER